MSSTIKCLFLLRVIILNLEKYIADRITRSSGNRISKPIVKIGILGIILGLAVMILTISIVLGFKKEITRKITGLSAHISISNIVYGSGGEQNPIVISEDSLAIFKTLTEVKYIQGVAYKNGILKTKTENEGILIKGVGSVYDFSFIKKHLQQGRLPEFKNNEFSKDILISENLANKLDLKTGGKLLVYFVVQRQMIDSASGQEYTKFEQRSRNFVICGIFKTSFSDFDNNLTFADIRQIQRLNYWDSTMVGSYEIMLKDFEKLDVAYDQLNEHAGVGYQISTVKEQFSNIFTWLDKLDVNGIIVIVLMIVVAVINMITALLILILERTNMVGMLKSLGMSNAGVRKIFFYISLKLLSRGLLWGNILGISLCLIQFYFHPAKLDSTVYYIDAVAVEINWLYYLFLNIGTIIVCFLMLFLPTLILTKITPVKTLRFD
jgi:lipoprotein-releasing system permease protein